MNIRARFEEIWPVPECAEWSDYFGKYLQAPNTWATIGAVAAYNARLDTFIRCQESMAPVLSLIEEMVADIEYLIEFADGNEPYSTTETLNQAKQLLEQKK